MYKQLILLRHGHRNTGPEYDSDNGLSLTGREQAQKIADYFQMREVNTSAVRICSSPTRRCRETLEPLSALLGVPVNVDDELHEQQGNENGDMFVHRIEQFITTCRYGDVQVTVACTHGDWIPYCTHLLTGTIVQPATGSWTEIALEDGNDRILSTAQP